MPYTAKLSLQELAERIKSLKEASALQNGCWVVLSSMVSHFTAKHYRSAREYTLWVLNAAVWVSLEISLVVCNHDLWWMLSKMVAGKGCEQRDLYFAILFRSQNQLLWDFEGESCMQLIIQRCHLSDVHSVNHFTNAFSCGWLSPEAVSEYCDTNLRHMKRTSFCFLVKLLRKKNHWELFSS